MFDKFLFALYTVYGAEANNQDNGVQGRDRMAGDSNNFTSHFKHLGIQCPVLFSFSFVSICECMSEDGILQISCSLS